MTRSTARKRVTRVVVGESRILREDVLAVEEPLEIRVGGRAALHHDADPRARLRPRGRLPRLGGRDLPHRPAERDPLLRRRRGRRREHLQRARCRPSHRASRVPTPSLERNFYMTSSCGLCGKASIDAVRTLSAYPVAADAVTVAGCGCSRPSPTGCARGQDVFEKTGGLHAAALFDAASGELLVLREDVGRHNAVDKVVGWALKEDRLPLTGTVLMVSGRASFELVQKASMAGIPVLAAVSAPSSLAVDLGRGARAHDRRLPARAVDGRLHGAGAHPLEARSSRLMHKTDVEPGIRVPRPRGRAQQGLGRRRAGHPALDGAGHPRDGPAAHREADDGDQPEGRLRLHELRVARPGRPQHPRVLRERRQGGHLGGDAGHGPDQLLGRELADQPARQVRVLARDAGPPHRARLQAARLRPLRAGLAGSGPSS